MRAENRLLQQKIDLLVRKVFGTGKSERFDPGQMELGLKGEDTPEEPQPLEAPAASGGKKSRRRNPPKPRYPEDLPVEETVLVPEEVEQEPENWRRIGEEVSEQLDYNPGTFFLRRTVRTTWVRRNDMYAAPVTPPLPSRLLDRGVLAPGLQAQIVIAKYVDHLPLYRQSKIFEQRHGVYLPRQSLARNVRLVADSLQLIVDAIKQDMLEQSYLQIDETVVEYLQPGAGKTKKGYMWVLNDPGGDVLFEWGPGRSSQVLRDLLPPDQAYLIQSDNYQAYSTVEREREELSLAACWAHVRRKFFEAEKSGDARVRSGWILHQVSLLYEIERHLREQGASAAERERIREYESLPIVQRLRRVFEHLLRSGQHRPQSLMGKSLGYAMSLGDRLEVYTRDGRVEIDNNLVENAIRPVALGRKNWLFIGAEEAGKQAAILYTILESCRKHGIDPLEYLRDILTRLPEETNQTVRTLTPRAWAAARAAEVKMVA